MTIHWSGRRKRDGDGFGRELGETTAIGRFRPVRVRPHATPRSPARAWRVFFVLAALSRPVVGATTALWTAALLVAVGAAHWGANRLAPPFEKLRRSLGLSSAAGGALVGLALAFPEVSITTSSVVLGAGDVGLGILVGGSVLSLPLLLSIAYVASRNLDHERTDDVEADGAEQRRVGDALLVEREAGSLTVLPYVGVVLLVVLLSLPAPLRGFQPVDAVVLTATYAVYLGQDLLRGRDPTDAESVDWSAGEFASAALGLVTVLAAAAVIVQSTERLVAALGVSPLVGGLFLTAPLGLAPEAFGTWRVVESGEVTAGSVDVVTDAAVTMTLALVPVGLAGLSISQFGLYRVSIAFAALLPAVYAVFVYWQPEGCGFQAWQVVAFDALYVAYVAVVLGWVLDVV